MKSVAILILILFPFMVVPNTLGGGFTQQTTRPEPAIDMKISEVLYHQPLDINYLYNFHGNGFPGSGTAADPYIIADLEIAGSDFNIRISYMSYFFVIRNCTFHGGGSGVVFTAGVENGKVENCRFYSQQNGLTIDHTANSSFLGNYFSSCSRSVYIESSNSCRISDSIIEPSESGSDSIWISGCNDIEVKNIEISSESDWGTAMTFAYCTGIVLANLNIQGHYRALLIGSSTNVSITGAMLKSNSGVYLSSTQSCIISDINLVAQGNEFTSRDSNNCIIENFQASSIAGGTFGIYSSINLTLHNSDLGEAIIDIDGWQPEHWLHTFENVTSFGKPVSMFINKSNNVIDLSSSSQAIIVNCQDVVFSTDESSSLVSLQMGVCSECNFTSIYLTNITNGGLLTIQHSERIHIANVIVHGQLSIMNSKDIHIFNISIQGQLSLQYSEDIQIFDLIVQSPDQIDIGISGCARVNITRFDMCWVSIQISNSPNGTLMSGSIQSQDRGISIYGSDGFTIEDCTISANIEVSILLYGMSVCRISACSLSTALDLNPYYDDWSQNDLIIENVTIAGRPLGVLMNLQSIAIDLSSYGQLILVNSSDVDLIGDSASALYGLLVFDCKNLFGSGIAFSGARSLGFGIQRSTDVTLANISHLVGAWFRVADSSHVSIRDTFMNSTSIELSNDDELHIQDCEFIECTLSFGSCRRSSFVNNSFFSSSWYYWGGGPFWLYDMEDSEISDNSLNTTGDHGLRGSVLINCTITKNVVISNWWGMYIDDANSCIIGRNRISSTATGIHLSRVNSSEIEANVILHTIDWGIYYESSNSSTVRSNIIRESNGGGIHLEQCSNFEISLNCLIDNAGRGLDLLRTTDSVIWGNYFLNNSEGNAYCEELTNTWRSNYYDDLNDHEFMNITGSAQDVDQTPIVLVDSELGLPAVSQLEDVVLLLGEPNPSLKWIIWTDQLITFTISHDNEILISAATDFPICAEWIITAPGFAIDEYVISIYRNGSLLLQDTVAVFMSISPSLISTTLASFFIACMVAISEIHRRKTREAAHLENPSIDTSNAGAGPV